MRFGPVAVGEAAGCVLAHTARVGGRVFGKGLVLDAGVLGVMAAAGWREVVVARLEPGDVAEDAAAVRVAAAVLGDGVAVLPGGTGRVNLAARWAGLFRAERGVVDALNGVDEGVTLGTLADAEPVQAGALVATVKVIPFAVAGGVVAQMEAVARGGVGLRVARFRPLRVGLVVSVVAGLKESVLAGTERVTAARVAALGGVMLPVRRVDHAVGAVAAAFAGLLAEGAEVLLLAGASAVVDRGDVGPAAIVAAGGVVEHFGMPVDPGNLICLGRVGAVPALVLPGCARSPALNGIDLVLRLVFAGEPAGRAAVMRMGVGGLLKETARRGAARVASGGRAEQVAAVVLAAGMSARAAPRHKLLTVDRAGVAMVGRVVQACCASRADEVVVVVGHQAEAVEAAVRAAVAGVPGAARVRFVRAAGYAEGLSASLRAGVAALGAEVGAVAVCLGDMPLVGGEVIDALVAAWCPAEARLIVVPVHEGRRGNPVLWDRRYFAAMGALRGDEGARALLGAHASEVVEVAAGASVLVDFDAGW